MLNFVEYEVHQKCTTGGLSWQCFHDLHSSYIVAAAIGASASGCTLGDATYNVSHMFWVGGDRLGFEGYRVPPPAVGTFVFLLPLASRSHPHSPLR